MLHTVILLQEKATLLSKIIYARLRNEVMQVLFIAPYMSVCGQRIGTNQQVLNGLLGEGGQHFSVVGVQQESLP